ncbi:transcriptional repressor LexA [Prosthecobacter sp. SYSU 5D2]|uniref:transcriptional repressor LexA n=1 Tax=Prosthecobacter sp. SYSU 5D2 TaxID=3134134 RepID=UPI0031FF3247
MFDFNTKLTDRQRELLDYLRQYQRENGVMPSTRDIQRHFGFSSQTAAMSHLRALEKKGVIQRHPNKARAVVFPEDLERAEIVDIPLYGMIPAGYASAQEQTADGSIAVDVHTLGLSRSAKAFALKVRGESMIGANICDGDMVILEAKEPRPRDIVAALIDGETTLKRFLIKEGRPYLQAENPDFPDLIPANELIIQGVMQALIRQVGRD